MCGRRLVKKKTNENQLKFKKKTYIKPKQCLDVSFGPVNIRYGGWGWMQCVGGGLLKKTNEKLIKIKRQKKKHTLGPNDVSRHHLGLKIWDKGGGGVCITWAHECGVWDEGRCIVWVRVVTPCHVTPIS